MILRTLGVEVYKRHRVMMHYQTRDMEVELNEITTSGQTSLLYEAAYSGDVSMLNSLIQRCPHILHKTSQTVFAETPLHISSLLGHLEFTEKLVTHKPNLALEVDSSRMAALHVASAEGHIHIVKELLKVNKETCLFHDEEGRIPLHYAAMRGRTKVVQELIKAKPESLSFCDNGKTVFHLCVTYNHIETLRALVELESAIYNGKLLNFTSIDDAGNTILHLAIMLKRVEVVSFLLSIPEIREIANLKNKIGFTGHDILEKCPKDFKTCKIQHMLTNAEKEEFETDHPYAPPLTSTDVVPPQNDGRCIKNFKCIGNFFMKILRWIGGLLRHEDQWLKEMRGNLSMVSTFIATITFQGLINPPGGFIQQNLVSTEGSTSSNGVLNCTMLDDQQYCPGEALASSSSHLTDYFQLYLLFITISFFSSLCVTLLLVSGIFPMKNRAVIWLASIGMCMALSSLSIAYIAAINIIIPAHLLQEKLIVNLKEVVFSVVWGKFVDLVVLVITLRFSIWVTNKSVRIFKKSRSWGSEMGCRRFLRVLFRIIVIFVMVVIYAVQLLIVFGFFSLSKFGISTLVLLL